MDQIVIKVIYDNCKETDSFQAGWGFSCLIDLYTNNLKNRDFDKEAPQNFRLEQVTIAERQGASEDENSEAKPTLSKTDSSSRLCMDPRKILFDTGADPKAFSSNLQKLGVSYEEITDVVFSHKHSDHIAGFEEIIGKLAKGSRLFLPKKFASKKIPSQIQVEIVEDLTEIYSGVYSLVLKGGFRLYEQALILQTQKGMIIITGCAHPGIIHLLETAQKRLKQPIHLVLGGFHLFRAKQSQIDEIINRFKDLHVQIAAPCHCSGELAIELFRQAFQDRFYKIGTGTILTLDP